MLFRASLPFLSHMSITIASWLKYVLIDVNKESRDWKGCFQKPPSHQRSFKNSLACADKSCRLNCFPSVCSNTAGHTCVLIMNSSRFHWRCDVLQAKCIIYVVYEICRSSEAELPRISNMHNENLRDVLRYCVFCTRFSAVCLALTCLHLKCIAALSSQSNILQ